MDDSTNFQEQETSDPREEEEVSLCNFPLNSEDDEPVRKDSPKTQHHRQSSSFSFCESPLNLSDDELEKKDPSKPHHRHRRSSSVSLCHFYLNLSDDDEPEKNGPASETPHHHRVSSSFSQPSDFFEFFNERYSDEGMMSHAEDIISCGKLLPYKQPTLFDYQILKSVSGDDEESILLSRRYREWLAELNPSRSLSTSSTRLTRSSRNSSMVMKSEASGIQRSSSKDSLKSEDLKGSKPRRHGWMFGGIAKFPREMDLQDIKNRQIRRSPGSMFPAVDGGGKVPVNRRSSWGDDLLRALSCKRQPRVAVKASTGAVPRV